MIKQEYLKNRFKRDFLQYSLLQEDSLSACQIVEKIVSVFEFVGIVDKLKPEIDVVCDKYFALGFLRDGGTLVSDLPIELNFDVKDRAVEEYSNYLDAVLNDDLIGNILNAILQRIEQQAWRNGIAEMPAVVEQLQSKIRAMALSYGDLTVDVLSVDELKQKYEAAKKNTLIERLQNSNIEDIVDYRSAMRVYVYARCMNNMYRKIKLFYERLADNGIFGQLYQNFESLLRYAEELKTSLPTLESNIDWDEEYNHLVPTEFYRRNVEDFTAEQAFHMVLLQFFARNEEWMIENKMLVDKDITIYTNQGVDLDEFMTQLLPFVIV